jgi:hypothetical protein
MVSKGSTLCHRCSVDCHPGGCRGNKEQVVAQWRCLVAFMKVLDLLHQAMLIVIVLHHCTAMVIEMARNGGAWLPPPTLIAVIVAKDYVMVH